MSRFFLETFVEKGDIQASVIVRRIGTTLEIRREGGKLDRYHRQSVPVKSVYVSAGKKSSPEVGGGGAMSDWGNGGTATVDFLDERLNKRMRALLERLGSKLEPVFQRPARDGMRPWPRIVFSIMKSNLPKSIITAP